jgi:predicted transcriptional regulator
MAKLVRLRDETVRRIDELFEQILMGNSDIAQNLAKKVTWDAKVNAILDRLEEALSRGG